MSSTINDDCDCSFDRKSREGTDALLNLLEEHHDFNLPRPRRKEVIEIRTAPEVALPVGICVLPIETRQTIEGIKRVVCRHFGISHTDMISPRRDHKVQRPRAIAIYLAREFTAHSLPEIGRRFGDRDHTTIIASIKRGEQLAASNGIYSSDISYLRQVLSA